MKKNHAIILLFALGLSLIIGAPFLCHLIYELFDFQRNAILYNAFSEFIPSVRLGGIVLSAWGMTLLHKK